MNFEQWWNMNNGKVKKELLNPSIASEKIAFNSFQYCFHEGRVSGFDEVRKQQEKIGDAIPEDEGVADWRQEEADVDFEKEAQDLPRFRPNIHIEDDPFGTTFKHVEEATAEAEWQKILNGVVYMSELFKNGTFVHLTGHEEKTGVVVGKIKERWYKIKISSSTEVEIVHESNLFIKAGAWSDLTTRVNLNQK